MSRLLRHRLIALGVLALAFSSGASLAHAQTEDPDRLIDQGIRARARGRDAEALELFERAHRARPTALSLAQLALAEQALGRWLEADEHLRAAMAMDDRWVTRNRATLVEAQSAIAQHVGSVQVEGSPAGATVMLADREIGTLPMAAPARVLVGRARLSVRADGHDSVEREIDVRPGQAVRETVTLTPTASSTPPPDTRAPPPPRRTRAPTRSGGGGALRTIGFVGLGVSGAAIVTGTVALVMREGHASDWNSDACLRNGRTRSENCQADLDAGETAELVSIIGFAAGGALLAGSIVLVLVGGSGDDGDATQESARMIGCSIGPGDVGVSCAGRF